MAINKTEMLDFFRHFAGMCGKEIKINTFQFTIFTVDAARNENTLEKWTGYVKCLIFAKYYTANEFSI